MTENNMNKKKMTLTSLTIPIFFELLLVMLMGNVDVLMVSHFSDKTVAAIGVANQVIFMVIVIYGFVSTGTVILNAQALGAKNKKLAAEISSISIITNLIFGLVMSLIIWIFGEKILSLMNVEKDVFNEAHTYLTIVGQFLFLQAVLTTMGAILRSYGFVKDTMYINVVMNAVHIVLNSAFLYGAFGFPSLGVSGMALSTVTTRFLGIIAMIIILKKRIDTPLPVLKVFKLPKTHLKNILRIGLPSAGEQLSYNLSQFAILFFITSLGTNAITTRIYAQNIITLIYLSSLALAQANQILIGYHIGAKEFDLAYKRCIKTFKIAGLISFLVAVLFYFLSPFLFGIFTENKHIIQVGSVILAIDILLEVGRTFNLVGISALRATGDVKFPLIIAIFSMWGVAVLFSYVFGIALGYGLAGMWLAFALDEWTRGVLVIKRWKNQTWMKYHKK